MPRKKRPPVPQSHRSGPAKSQHPNRPVVGPKSNAGQDRSAFYMYYVPLLFGTYVIVRANVRYVGGRFVVHQWSWLILFAVLWVIGPFYLRMLRELRKRFQG